MTRSRRTRAGLACALVCAPALVSCVSQRLYDEQVDLNTRLQRANHDYAAYQQELESENASLRDELALMSDVGLTDADFPVPDDVEQRIADLQALMERLGRGDGDVTAFPVSDGIGYRLSESIVFGLASTEISSAGQEVLRGLAEEFAGLDAREIQVRGHTDDVPIVRPETRERFPHGNLELASARAIEVAAFLAAQDGIDESRVTIAAYGPHDPLYPNDSTENRARNRRVEIYVLD